MGGTAKKKIKNHSTVRVPPTTPKSTPCAPRVPSGWTGASAPGEHRGRAAAAPATHALHPPESSALSNQTGSTREARNTTK